MTNAININELLNPKIVSPFLGEIAGVPIKNEVVYNHVEWMFSMMAESTYFSKLFADPKFKFSEFVADYAHAFHQSWLSLDETTFEEMESELRYCLSYFDDADKDDYPKFAIHGNELHFDSVNINLYEQSYIS